MGGGDDSSNLVSLTVENHALAHKTLYEKFGKKEDKLAWLCLSKQIGNEEIWLERSSIGGTRNKGVPKSIEHRKKISNKIKTSYYDDPSKKAKISNTMKNNKNSKNHKTEEYRKKQSEVMKKAWEKRLRGSSAGSSI